MAMISRVLVLTPVFRETFSMIERFMRTIEDVRLHLKRTQDVNLEHFFLDDGASSLPENYVRLVHHPENRGVAETLVDGYREAQNLPGFDAVVRIDCQEHDPWRIPDIVEHFEHSRLKAIYLPIRYWVRGEARPTMLETNAMIAGFFEALSPIDEKTVNRIYNVEFPIGYQAYMMSALEYLVPKFMSAIASPCVGMFEGGKIRWGMDLLAILLMARRDRGEIDFMFGGWAEPWQVNRPPEKILAQAEQNARIIQIARDLGCT